jgi:hypothetical protein
MERVRFRNLARRTQKKKGKATGQSPSRLGRLDFLPAEAKEPEIRPADPSRQ